MYCTRHVVEVVAVPKQSTWVLVGLSDDSGRHMVVWGSDVVVVVPCSDNLLHLHGITNMTMRLHRPVSIFRLRRLETVRVVHMPAELYMKPCNVLVAPAAVLRGRSLHRRRLRQAAFTSPLEAIRVVVLPIVITIIARNRALARDTHLDLLVVDVVHNLVGVDCGFVHIDHMRRNNRLRSVLHEMRPIVCDGVIHDLRDGSDVGVVAMVYNSRDLLHMLVHVNMGARIHHIKVRLMDTGARKMSMLIKRQLLVDVGMLLGKVSVGVMIEVAHLANRLVSNSILSARMLKDGSVSKLGVVLRLRKLRFLHNRLLICKLLLVAQVLLSVYAGHAC